MVEVVCEVGSGYNRVTYLSTLLVKVKLMFHC